MKNPSRVVNVSSILARHSLPLDFKNLSAYAGDHIEYPKSKLCQILFTTELAKRCANTNVTTYSLHPGFVRTNIFGHFWPWIRQIIHFTANIYGKVRFYSVKNFEIRYIYNMSHFNPEGTYFRNIYP